MTLTLEISDELLEKLNAVAKEQHSSLEDVALRAIGESVGANGVGANTERETLDFESAAEYVLDKNAELYRRLA